MECGANGEVVELNPSDFENGGSERQTQFQQDLEKMMGKDSSAEFRHWKKDFAALGDNRNAQRKFIVDTMIQKWAIMAYVTIPKYTTSK